MYNCYDDQVLYLYDQYRDLFYFHYEDYQHQYKCLIISISKSLLTSTLTLLPSILSAFATIINAIDAIILYIFSLGINRLTNLNLGFRYL